MEINYVEIDENIEIKMLEKYEIFRRHRNLVPQSGERCNIAAMHGNEVVGVATCSRQNWTPPLDMYSDAFIQWIDVDEKFRRQGIARYMVGLLEKWAKRQGFRQIRAWSNYHAVAALHMWYALDYAMCPSKEPILNKDGTLHEIVTGYKYAKFLNSGVLPSKEYLRKYWYAYIYEQKENKTDDVDYILSTIGDSSKCILEVACGGGRILEPLARAGHNINGFDMDEHMLRRCEARIKGIENASCKKMDAIKKDWGSDYDVVIMGGNILVNIVSDMEYEKAQQLFIQKAAGALKTGGRLFLECSCETHFETSYDTKEYTIFKGIDDMGTDGKFIMFDLNTNGDTRIQKSKRRIEIISKGEKWSIEWDVIKYFPNLKTIQNWLNEAGLEIESIVGNFNGEPMSEQTKKAIIWAKRV